MKKWLQRIKPLVTNQLSLPADLVFDMPRMTVIGQLHVYIENHRGLKKYTTTELTLQTTGGHVRIQGEQFVIKMMLPEEILLEGTIEHITFITE